MPDPATAALAITEEGGGAEGAGEGQETGAGPDAPQMTPVDEGLLFMDTVSETYLRSHPTVVLSGSHAASGDLSHDAVLGMPRAFLAAGARSVLASMWDAVDEPASALVAKFYSVLQARGGAHSHPPTLPSSASPPPHMLMHII